MTTIPSANAKNHFALATTSAPPPREWHEAWRLELLEEVPFNYGALITNITTLFSFLIPLSECNTITRLIDCFRMRLQFSLIAANSSIQVDPAPPVFTPGNPRPVIGTMNDMIKQLHFLNPGDDPEKLINNTPFGIINYEYASERFHAQLKK
jgi:hypothetical protein